MGERKGAIEGVSDGVRDCCSDVGRLPDEEEVEAGRPFSFPFGAAGGGVGPLLKREMNDFILC